MEKSRLFFGGKTKGEEASIYIAAHSNLYIFKERMLQCLRSGDSLLGVNREKASKQVERFALRIDSSHIFL